MDFPTIGAPDSGDTAWMLMSTALVLLMTPGLALFYGGMVRTKSVLNMIMMSISAMGVVGILWVVYGYSMVFGDDIGSGLLGDPGDFFAMDHYLGGTYLGDDTTEAAVPLVGTIPAVVFVAFQAMFAIITVALISGAVADRMKFVAWLAFSALWATIVYFPVAHWVFSFDGVTAPNGGWIANVDDLGAIDFAGGTAVHINAGVAGLVLCIVLGKRKGWPREPMRPHNLPFVMLGAALLWFGWFGFNAGSAVGSNGIAGVTFLNTVIATCAAMLAWLVVEWIRDGAPTTLGGASGIVAGLVAITPACSAVSPMGAIAVGGIAGALCALAIALKYKLGFDDSLDVVGVHLVGGLAGTLLIGFFATEDAPAAVDGIFYGGGAEQLWRQAAAAGAVIAWCGVATAIIAFALKFTIGIRVSEEVELTGIDESAHAEAAYDTTGLRGGGGGISKTADTFAARAAAPAGTEA